jgi:hypothetical protein
MAIMAGGGAGSGGPIITAIDFVPGSPGSLTLTWQSRPGTSYRVESSPDLQALWQEEADALLADGTSTTRTIEIIDGKQPKLFFRVSEE